MVSDEEHDFYELPANQAPLGPGRRRRRNRWADGLWNGRPIEEWIPEVVADVVKGFGPARVIVFGSVTRGDATADSDLDLFVLFGDLQGADRRRLMGQIRAAITAPIPIDVLVAEVAEFEAGKDVNGSPFYWPAREGRVVYEQPSK